MKLTPKVSDEIKEFLDDKNYAFNLVNEYGSPLNIIFPSAIQNNVCEFEEVFKKFKIKGHIYFAHKCNKSSAIVKEMICSNVNIDVASQNELSHALSCGYVGNKIEATGPKNDEFIILGLRHNIIFNVDSIFEINSIIEFHKKMDKKERVKILIRLTGFSSQENKFVNKISRFGTPISQINDIFKVILSNKNILDFVGFSFHLDTVSLKEKAVAIENVIELFSLAYEFELNPHIIDIGGGFKVNYLESEQGWNDAISQLKESVVSLDSNIAWNNSSFGLRTENGVIKGNLNIYNYFDSNVKGKFLSEIFAFKSSKFQNRSLGEILSENMIEVFIEPGRSLLDNAGINLARITYTKTANNDDLLVGLDMNRSNLLIGDQEMLVDPILLSSNEEKKEKNTSAFLLGNLCLESDVIFKHKVAFNFEPKKNDLIVFVNTAGYFMDFSESETIMQSVAKKIVLTKIENKFECFLDKTYEPLKIRR